MIPMVLVADALGGAADQSGCATVWFFQML
jgi:hypothetical protein